MQNGLSLKAQRSQLSFHSVCYIPQYTNYTLCFSLTTCIKYNHQHLKRINENNILYQCDAAELQYSFILYKLSYTHFYFISAAQFKQTYFLPSYFLVSQHIHPNKHIYYCITFVTSIKNNIVFCGF